MLLHTDNFNHTDLFQPHKLMFMINIFKAVHEDHINQSKIGKALISEIVTVFITHTCIYKT